MSSVASIFSSQIQIEIQEMRQFLVFMLSYSSKYELF